RNKALVSWQSILEEGERKRFLTNTLRNAIASPEGTDWNCDAIPTANDATTRATLPVPALRDQKPTSIASTSASVGPEAIIVVVSVPPDDSLLSTAPSEAPLPSLPSAPDALREWPEIRNILRQACTDPLPAEITMTVPRGLPSLPSDSSYESALIDSEMVSD